MNEQKLSDWVEVKLGRSYSAEFVSAIADQAGEILIEWLKANNAPQEVIDLADSTIILERCRANIENGNLSDWNACFLGQELPGITELIAQLGGTFASSDLVSSPREKVITWQPAPQTNQER
jgi:hypothetical protein